MKRNLLVILAALAIAIGVHGLAWALGGATGPHADYRTGYGTGCSGNAACHTLTKVSFLPEDITNNPAVNFTNFCLSCHNKSGEAHEKSPGSPSNNSYINLTGLVPGDRGVSHNWNGRNKNAGTRTPVATFFNRTGYMPQGIVACQTCHNAPKRGSESFFPTTQPEPWAPTVDQGDHINYVINLGSTTSTPEYLNKYIRVFRSPSYLSAPPTERRARKQYLVDPSEYTYNNQNLTITFNTSQGTDYIYADMAEPYMRGSNAANALCADCHINRVNTSGVAHEPGTGAKDNHPVQVAYGHASGLNDTIKPSASGNVYLEKVMGNDQVLCTSCHDPHNAASGNGQILREADGSALCADCHKTKLDGYSTAGSVNSHNGSKHASPTVCLDCHGTHDSRNIMLVKNVINGKWINFRNFSGANSFGNDTGYGICEACHSATTYHLASGGGAGHNTGKNCIACHKHETGFAAGGCTGCHGVPPAPGNAGPSGWADDNGDKHSNHMGYILTNFGLSGTAACATCHGSKPGDPHPENLDTAYIDTSSPVYWGGGTFDDGGTIGKTNTADDTCTNVACHSGGATSGTRVWGGTGPATCDTCHPYPGSATNAWASTNGHSVRYDDPRLGHMAATGYDAATDTYDAMVADNTKCGKCHPNNPANHQNGTKNLNANGWAACGGGNFTFNNITTGKVVTCSNVLCHSGKTTPNWY